LNLNLSGVHTLPETMIYFGMKFIQTDLFPNRLRIIDSSIVGTPQLSHSNYNGKCPVHFLLLGTIDRLPDYRLP